MVMEGISYVWLMKVERIYSNAPMGSEKKKFLNPPTKRCYFPTANMIVNATAYPAVGRAESELDLDFVIKATVSGILTEAKC